METQPRPAVTRVSRRLPIGAEPLGADGAHFRVWAPRSTRVSVVLAGIGGARDASTPLRGRHGVGRSMTRPLLILARHLATARARGIADRVEWREQVSASLALTLNRRRAWSVCPMQQPASRDSVADRSPERAVDRPAAPRARPRAASPRPSEPREPGAPPLDASAAARPDREQLIASRAYGLYLERGMAHGADIDDWLEAERQVDDELTSLAR